MTLRGYCPHAQRSQQESHIYVPQSVLPWSPLLKALFRISLSGGMIGVSSSWMFPLFRVSHDWTMFPTLKQCTTETSVVRRRNLSNIWEKDPYDEFGDHLCLVIICIRWWSVFGDHLCLVIICVWWPSVRRNQRLNFSVIRGHCTYCEQHTAKCPAIWRSQSPECVCLL